MSINGPYQKSPSDPVEDILVLFGLPDIAAWISTPGRLVEQKSPELRWLGHYPARRYFVGLI